MNVIEPHIHKVVSVTLRQLFQGYVSQDAVARTESLCFEIGPLVVDPAVLFQVNLRELYPPLPYTSAQVPVASPPQQV